ncbi:hypothetical protein MTR_7g083635 [Medicago truncatula]|uniref:Uncharacterized protein n=1 Tax=Medicago truncatula TaxID=3880 RepID=A0A072U2W9_MEDTR|nr:hypothetical protein MTR_7g083635 [Medicago truncatula]
MFIVRGLHKAIDCILAVLIVSGDKKPSSPVCWQIVLSQTTSFGYLLSFGLLTLVCAEDLSLCKKDGDVII